MERDGDVATEIISCATQNFPLNYNLCEYKMCKDDISSPLFCSIPECLVNNVMNSIDNITENVETVSSDFSRRSNTYTDCERHIISLINKKSDLMKSCVLPLWEQTSNFCEFSPKSEKRMDELYGQNSYLNGSKVLQAPIDVSPKLDSKSLSSSTTDSTTETTVINFDFPTNTSPSIEGTFCLSRINNEAEKNTFCCEKSFDPTPEKYLSNSRDPCNFLESNEISPCKSDRIMPTLISPNNNLSKCDQEKITEVIDVADSPEMPTLIPFTSEVDEAIRIKIERVSEEKRKLFDKENPSVDNEMLQPQVLLRRISLDNNVPAKNLKCKNSQGKGSLDDFEIEEIEGIRFFQFLSKQEMEDFNRKPEVTESDDNMIVPTKTTDITQIKGWRKKYFAHQSKFPIHNSEASVSMDLNAYFSAFNGNEVNSDQNYLEVENNADHSDNGTDSKNNESKKTQQESNKNGNASKESAAKTTGNNSELLKNEEGRDDSDSENEDKPISKMEVKDENPEVKNINSIMSAFVSEKLESYLSKSSVLNVSYLEKINPNIIPISPNAPILSIGKLRKVEDGCEKLKAKNFSYKVKSYPNSDDPISLVDNSTNDSVISICSTNESSSDDDCSVSKFKKSEPQNFKTNYKQLRKRQAEDSDECEETSEKKKSVDLASKQTSKRVVLRLTKDGNGNSDGYKVSNISLNKMKKDSKNVASSSESINESSPFTLDIDSEDEKICREFEVGTDTQSDSNLPLIKQTLISNDGEFQILEEFLHNLTKYGTSHDVAMLVQSNRSYIDNEPNFTSSHVKKYLMNRVSNEKFLQAKTEQGIKKTKSWKKNLHKNLDKNQKALLPKSRKRKLSTELLEGLSGTERGKRSIRLPARYLDSAVLAAGTEWVSPVINMDDNPVRKLKRQSPERLSLHKLTEQKKYDLESEADTISNIDKSSNCTNINKYSDKFQVSTKRASTSKQDFIKKSAVPVNKLSSIKGKTIQQSSSSSSSSSASSSSSSSSSSSDDDDDDDETTNLTCPSCCCSSRTFTYHKTDKMFLCPLHHREPKNEKNKNVTVLNSSNTIEVGNILESSFNEELNESHEQLLNLSTFNLSPNNLSIGTNVVNPSHDQNQKANVVINIDKSSAYVNVPAVVNDSNKFFLVFPRKLNVNQNVNVPAVPKICSEKQEQKKSVTLLFPKSKDKLEKNISLKAETNMGIKIKNIASISNMNVLDDEASSKKLVEAASSNFLNNHPTLQFIKTLQNDDDSDQKDDFKDINIENVTSIHENYHDYFKKENPDNLSTDDDSIDVDTIDESFNARKELKGDAEFCSDVSDTDFLTTISDRFCIENKRKLFIERKRRLVMRIRVEELQKVLKPFMNCKSMIETLDMAQLVVRMGRIQSKVLKLAKKRLLVQNSLLMKKLEETIEDLEIMKEEMKNKKESLSSTFDYKPEKSPLDSEETTIENFEPNIDEKNEHFSAIIDKHDEGSSHSGSANEEERLSVKSTVDGIRKRLEETLSKGKNEEYFKSDSDDPLIIDLCDDSPANEYENSVVDLSCAEVDNKKNNASKSGNSYPSMIPLFHPRVCEQAIAKRLLKSRSSAASGVSLESDSGEKDLLALNVMKNNLLSHSDDTSLTTSTLRDVSSFKHKDHSPYLKANFEGCHSETFDGQNSQKPTDITHAAVTQFGPCKVQEVQLSSGKTVFAYERHDLTENSSTSVNYQNLPHQNRPVTPPSSGNGVRNLKDAFKAVSNESKLASNAKVPEEITIDDSDEEVHEIDSTVPARTSNTSVGQSSVLNVKLVNSSVEEHNSCSTTNNLNL